MIVSMGKGLRLWAWLPGVLVLFLAIQTFAEDPPQSLWTSSVESGEGEPNGYAQFRNYCTECHGDGWTGSNPLKLKYEDTQTPLLEERIDLTSSVVEYFVRNGAGIMPPSRRTEISDDDLELLAGYLSRNAEELERAAVEVQTGKVPSRASLDVPLTFSVLSALPASVLPADEGLTDPQARGKALFGKACIYCHGAGGYGTHTLERRLRELNEQFDSLPAEMKETSTPVKRVGVDQAELAKRDNLLPNFVFCVVRSGVRNMPQYPPLDLSDNELYSVAAYLTRNNTESVAPLLSRPDCEDVIQ